MTGKEIIRHQNNRLRAITLADCKRSPTGCRDCQRLGMECRLGRLFQPATTDKGQATCQNRE